MNKPIISVGITTYNNEDSILVCLDSILNQNFDSFEIIIINDGSTDNTKQLLEKYSKNNKCRIINETQNLGAAVRHNQLSILANGSYLAKIDADDIMYSDRLKTQFEYMDSNPKLEITSGYSLIFNKKGVKREKKFSKIKISTFELFLENNIVHSTVMGKVDFFLKNKYDEKLLRAQDLELWLRSINSENYHFINKPFVYYKISPILSKKIFLTLIYKLEILKKYRSKLSFIQYILLFTFFKSKTILLKILMFFKNNVKA